ncbi:DUF4393 domain-containing protein [Herbaspirillum robiniae]|uniref:DUF4393 domain-containing protein n=1 Tax=Herbaspirillum robiniae TaxID=2014887 RepID=A0A246WLW0_9BURK|nr:DUF4393 domain-containing protein [Herbaspirillum robiniae]OWY27325.1 hypothetical protein CEJ42_19935 [Herbaspirillum robiniae]
MEEEIKTALKTIPVEKVYDHLLGPAFREIGDAAKNGVKAARFLLAPIDYLAAQHDRWQRLLKRISEKVPEENLIEAHPQIAGTAIEGMRYLEDDNILTEMFINLLARSIDKERVNEAHPAFAKIISHMSPDEAQILKALKQKHYDLVQTAQYDKARNLFSSRQTESNTFPLDILSHSQNFFIYMDHLYSLNLAGVWQKGNQEAIHVGNVQTAVRIRNDICLTPFGQLFVKACVPDASETGSSEKR